MSRHNDSPKEPDMPKPRTLHASNAPEEPHVPTMPDESDPPDTFGQSPIPDEAGPDPFGDQLDEISPREDLPPEPEPHEGEDPGFDDDQPDDDEARRAMIDSIVREADAKLFSGAPPAALLCYSPESIDLDAVLAKKWGEGSVKGWASVKLNLKARVTSPSQAAALEEHLPGAAMVYRAGTPPEGTDPLDLHLHWTPPEDALDWSIVQMGDVVPADDPLHAHIKATASIKSLTMTSSKGTVVFSVGVHIEVPIAALPGVDALHAQSVRVKARLAQGKLPV